MARYRRKRSRRKSKRDFEHFTLPALFIIAGYLISIWLKESGQLVDWAAKIISWTVSTGAIIFLVYFAFTQYKKYSRYLLAKEIIEKNKQEIIYNFINRFGTEGDKHSWNYRGNSFMYERMHSLASILIDNGISISKYRKKQLSDIIHVLQYFINEKEDSLTRASLAMDKSWDNDMPNSDTSANPESKGAQNPNLNVQTKDEYELARKENFVRLTKQNFSTLSGHDFERLLLRLYEATGYATQHVGGTGDQGADLIANKAGRRIMIQAKRYKWNVDNSAVQQAYAAMKFYDCNQGMVISSADNFTTSAKQLAKATNIELISKDRLSEMLLSFLGESWG